MHHGRLTTLVQQLTGASLLMFGALTATSQAIAQEAANSTPRAAITSGTLEGRALPSGVNAYLGIPYAAPPVRELRWREPQPVKAWEGTYHADRFGPQCMQPQRGILTNQYSGAEITSEDCLYLNVWAKPGLKKAPVIVFLHGGGFFIGAASMPLYSGENIAKSDVIFVNLNYRVGPLGFLSHPELSAESGHHASGNYGFLDQIAALRWVRDNIAQFGGDPSNVTIAGQSAGSMSVIALQTSPLAKGLFQRAVGMSGAIIGSTGPGAMRQLAQAEQDGVRAQEMWKAGSLADLRAMPADRLVVPWGPGSPPVGPIEDGYVLPYSIAEAFDRSAQSDVPLLLGFTRDEALGGFGRIENLADYRRRAAERFGERTDAFLKLYPASTDEEAQAQARVADRDSTMASAMDAWARAQTAKGKAPVYSYMFARPHSYLKDVKIPDLDLATAGAYHTSEVPFWLNTIDSFNRFRQTRDWSAADRTFSTDMMNSLIAFAGQGNPNTAKLTWVRFDPKKPRLLELGTEAHIAAWPDQHRLEFFRSSSASRPSGGVARD